MVRNPSVLLIGKKNDFYYERAIEFVKVHFQKYQVFMGKRNEQFPEDIDKWQGDYIVSYLSPWIIPNSTLKKAKKACINFHPGPPEYPGIGCTNFAIYNKENTFGVTCHHMEEKVDTGRMVAVRRFPLYESDTVFSLTQRCYEYIFKLFCEVITPIVAGDELAISEEFWKRKPLKRIELQELCKISPEMAADEIKRRVKAVTFPKQPGAYIEVGGIIFNYQTNKTKNLHDFCKISPDMPVETIWKKINAFNFPKEPSAYVEIDGEIFIAQFN